MVSTAVRMYRDLHQEGWLFETPEGNSVVTEGTTSSGFVEALTYAKAYGHGLIVDGGPTTVDGQMGAIDVSAPIVVPGLVDMFVHMRGTTLCFQSGVTGNALTFGPLMRCDLQLGSLTYKGTGAAVIFKPSTGGVVASKIEFGSLGVYAGSGARSHVEFDFSDANATIVANKIKIRNFASGLGAPDSLCARNFRVVGPTGDGSVFRYNHVELGACMHASVAGIEIGQSSADSEWIHGNTWDISQISPAGASAIGIDAWCEQDTFRVGMIDDGEGGLATAVRTRPTAKNLSFDVATRIWGPNFERPYTPFVKLHDEGSGTRWVSR